MADTNRASAGVNSDSLDSDNSTLRLLGLGLKRTPVEDFHDAFVQFPGLPFGMYPRHSEHKYLDLTRWTELRIHIFKLALNTPRVVKVKLTRIGTTAIPKLGLKYYPDASLGLLHVNKESRAEALKVYKICFEGGKPDGKKCSVYIHPRFDTLLITLPRIPRGEDRDEFQPINYSHWDLGYLGPMFPESVWRDGSVSGRVFEQRFAGGKPYQNATATLVIMPADSNEWVMGPESLISVKVERGQKLIPGTWNRNLKRVVIGSWEHECLKWLVEWKRLTVSCDQHEYARDGTLRNIRDQDVGNSWGWNKIRH